MRDAQAQWADRAYKSGRFNLDPVKISMLVERAKQLDQAFGADRA